MKEYISGMKAIASLLLFVASLSYSVCGQSTRLLYGSDFVYSLSAPYGWVFDTRSGKGLGLDAVFYPEGLTFKKSPIVIYVNVVYLNDSTQKNWNDVHQGNASDFNLRMPDSHIEIKDKVGTMVGGKYAHVAWFRNDKKKQYEAVSYFEEDGFVVQVVVGTKDPALFDQHYADYIKLVASYVLVLPPVKFPGE
ncbi:MAG: hypothetical protein Kow0075_04210 [Salibacteraceae bacterium]